MFCSRQSDKLVPFGRRFATAVRTMAPTKHPSAWRLNKGEQASVEEDLATWEATLAPDVSEEEKLTRKEEERKRLIRALQQAKHEASLQKQSVAGAKNKVKGAAKAKAQAAAGASQPSGVPLSPSSAEGAANSEYYEQVKQDLAVVSKILGSDLKEILPMPIAAMVTDSEKTGIQDGEFQWAPV